MICVPIFPNKIIFDIREYNIDKDFKVPRLVNSSNQTNDRN